MNISGYMNYFSVNDCGLYRNGQNLPQGCNLVETFDLIHKWLKGREMEDTLPWDPTSRSAYDKCYCHDIYKDDSTGDILLVLWKSSADSTGTIWGAQASGTIGSGKVVKYTDNYSGKKVVWGRPCYYWIVPSKDTVISVRFDHSVSDSFLFQDWVKACITNRVPHPNKSIDQTPQGHARFSFDDGTAEGAYRFRYDFNVGLRTVSTSGAELASLAAKVTHIVKRESIQLKKVSDQRADWLKRLGGIAFLAPKANKQSRRIEIKAEANPTADQLRAIISGAQQNRKHGDWDNVGFTTKDGNIVWVDKYRLKNHIELEHDMKGAIPAAVLYDALDKDRAKYLRPLAKPQLKQGHG